LREYDCGVMENRSDDATWQRWQKLHDAWVIHKKMDERIEGGESLHDVRQRFAPFIHELVNRYAATMTEILCISHNGIDSLMHLS